VDRAELLLPAGVDRVILPRELRLEEVAQMARAARCEMFVHGALCPGYSGQCLFSSMAGGRSGNSGMCAQPCRQRHNGSYPLSTRDLCLLERLPEVIRTGAVALKVEGRMRGPLYVGVVARVYRKYVDRHYADGDFRVDGRDPEELRMASNRDFTTGLAFNDSVVDPRWPHNRGLFLGTLEKGRLRLEADLRVGDGVAAHHEGRKSGNTVRRLVGRGGPVGRARRGEVVHLEVRGGPGRGGRGLLRYREGGFRKGAGGGDGGREGVLNCSELGLFNRTRDLLAIGVRRFYIEAERNAGRTVASYMKIISGRRFNGQNARRGRTTGHPGRGVA